jgi:dihydrofolate reductase
VLTRDRDWHTDGVVVVRSLGQALGVARDAEEVVAIGGAEIYRLLMRFARRIYLTLIHAEIPGDTFFPDFDPTQWADVECHSYPADDRHAYPFTFMTLDRKSAPQAPGNY